MKEARNAADAMVVFTVINKQRNWNVHTEFNEEGDVRVTYRPTDECGTSVFFIRPSTLRDHIRHYHQSTL